MNRQIYKQLIISTALSIPLAVLACYILVILISINYKTDHSNEDLGILVLFFMAGYFGILISTVVTSLAVYLHFSRSAFSALKISKRLLIIFAPFLILSTIFSILTGVGFVIFPPLLIMVFTVYLGRKIWKLVCAKLFPKSVNV